MKTILPILFCLLISSASFPQFGGQQIISTQTSNPFRVYVADIDGDGDMDVLSASYGDNTIAWYENMDGLGTFGPIRVITTSLDSTRYLSTADLDGDNDMDVLATSLGDDLVVWYKNTNGLGTFSGPFIIDDNAIRSREVLPADLDDDGDMDVIASNDIALVWYESDSSGNFSPPRVISNSISLPKSFAAIDIDGDNDKDIVASSIGNQKILWFENMDGLGNFGVEQVISTNAPGVDNIFAADLDNDGDADVLSISSLDFLDWYENTDGLGTFGPQQIITTLIDSGVEVCAADLDNDGDMDVLSASTSDNKIAWYENDGQGSFGVQQIITVEAGFASSVFTADLDGNGLEDVLSTSIADNKVAWYKNEILGVDDFSLEGISLYPNPAKNKLSIQNTGNLKIVRVRIYDALGRLILEKNHDPTQLNLFNFNEGLFFVEVTTDRGRTTKKLIKY